MESDHYSALGFLDIPDDIIVEIFEYLSISKLVKISSTNKRLNTIFKTHEWTHCIVKVNKTAHISYLVRNYQFKKYDFSNSEIKLLQFYYSKRTFNY